MATEDVNNKFHVNQDVVAVTGEDSPASGKMSKMGFQIVNDFFLQMAIERRMFQVRAGDVTTPLVSDTTLVDATAEMAADCVSGLVIIPAYVSIGITDAPGTANRLKIQSVAGASSGGTDFVPLPLYMGGRSPLTTGNVDPAGGVTVPAEAITTTRLHYAAGSGIAQGAYESSCEWNASDAPPILVGASCLYVQIGATTTGQSYFATINYIELPTEAVS